LAPSYCHQARPRAKLRVRATARKAQAKDQAKTKHLPWAEADAAETTTGSHGGKESLLITRHAARLEMHASMPSLSHQSQRAMSTTITTLVGMADEVALDLHEDGRWG
jgi:hypothetical protein